MRGWVRKNGASTHRRSIGSGAKTPWKLGFWSGSLGTVPAFYNHSIRISKWGPELGRGGAGHRSFTPLQPP